MSAADIIHDLHVHSRYSPDSTEEMEAYAKLGLAFSCHVGFLDHFEIAFTSRPGYLSEEQIPQLLETFDDIHANYPNTSLGLEVDFYPDLISEVAEFCDKHRRDFTHFIGAVHTVDRLAVTTREEMDVLVQRYGLFEVIKRYFDEVEDAIRSDIFAGIAHIDGVMRFASLYTEFKQVEEFWFVRTLEVGRLCRDLGLVVEVNLGGLRHPWRRTYPRQDIIDRLIEDGTRFFVGSDSHTAENFADSLHRIQEITDYLQQKGALQLPRGLSSKASKP